MGKRHYHYDRKINKTKRMTFGLNPDSWKKTFGFYASTLRHTIGNSISFCAKITTLTSGLNFREHYTHHIPARVGEPQEVVEAVAVSVVGLRALLVLDHDVGREHAA